VLLTGRAGAGKQTNGNEVVTELRARGRSAGLVDVVAVSQHLVGGSSPRWLCQWLVESGLMTVVSAPIPEREEREQLRAAVPALLEIFVDAPVDVCAARAGQPDPGYEEPYAPDLRVPTHDRAPRASAAQVLSFLEEHGLGGGGSSAT